MSLAAHLPDLAIEPMIIEGLMAFYFAGVERQGDAATRWLLARTADAAFMADAREAAIDAVVLSTLAGTLQHDKDFLELVAEQTPFADTFHVDMRNTLFAAGIESATMTTKQDAATRSLLVRRGGLYRAGGARA